MVVQNPLDEIRDALASTLEQSGIPFAQAQVEAIALVMDEQRRASEELFGQVFDFSGGPPQGGVVARIVPGPHDAHRQDPHWPMRYDTGRPSSVIRLRIAQPRTTSLPCPAGLRARRPSPMMDL